MLDDRAKEVVNDIAHIYSTKALPFTLEDVLEVCYLLNKYSKEELTE